MPSSKPSTVVARGGRQVACTWCGKTSEVAPSAKSVVCPHCNKRLVVEDLRVSTYQAVRLLATCGDVVIDKPGHVIAAVRAVNLTVGGKLTGDVVVLDKVVVQKTATIKGDIQASRLRVEGGATLDGYLRIGVAPRAGDAAKAD